MSTNNRCEKCNAYCCRHVAIGIDTPVCDDDYDTIRWFLLHENVWIAIDPLDEWLIEFKTPCRNITSENKCGDYENRPDICKYYPAENELCEGETDAPSYKALFKNAAELEAYRRSI